MRDELRAGSPGASNHAALRYADHEHLWDQEWMGRCGGFICYSAPPPILRQHALHVHGLRAREGNGASEMDYHYLAEARCWGSWGADGEVQIFCDYQDRVAAAVKARRELAPNPKQPVLCDALQYDISHKRDVIRRRRQRNRRRPALVSH